jgi:acyl-CoA synthetase (AMP-forming)/AMP-acid ligase II
LLPILPNSLYELYGLTEGFITVLDSANFARKIDSVGTPIPFGGMRIVSDDGRDLPPGQPGEIVGYSPLMMPGYYKRPDLTAQTIVDGWLHTGDVGMVDEDGYLHLVDRKKDMIISGGVNIYPAEIENALRAHPSVFDVAVFGAPHPEWGEEVRAVVECIDGRSVTESELLAFVKSELAAYKRPRAITFVRELPRNAAGKILKTELRAPFWKPMGTTI